MEFSAITSKMQNLFHKYRYGLIVIAIGIILLLIPTNHQKEIEEPVQPEIVQIDSLESRLSEVLSLVEGAGNTHVLLTISAGEETIYQVDEQTNTNTDSSETKITTITVTSKEKNQNGLIRQVNPPSYLGAIVVCHGADKPSIKLAIIDAVSNVTGLGTNQISVLKMK